MANEAVFSPVPQDAVYVPEPIETTPEVNDVVTPPVVETPAATPSEEPVEVPPTDEPIDTPTDIPVETPEPTAAQIKEVEKIVVKYPDMDEFQQTILDYIVEGKIKELGQFLADSQRDYNTMSDYDAVKADMMKKNPHYTNEIAELKMERQYGELGKIDISKINAEDNPDEYLAAEAHNRKVEDNLKLLKLDAFDARTALTAGQKEIKLPKINKEEVQTPEPLSAEAIEQGRRDWLALVDTEIPNLKGFTFKVGDKDIGYEDVSYGVTDAERKEQREFLSDLDFKKMVTDLGWVDENGKQNVQKMAGDRLKLKKIDQMVSSAYKQGHTTGTKSTVAGIKNIDLKAASNSSVSEQPVDIGKLGFGHLNPQ